MTQEEKQLLLKDLCARLPYGVKVELTKYKKKCLLCGIDGEDLYLNIDYPVYLGDSIKPYLRSMSSMTEEEEQKYYDLTHQEDDDVWGKCLFDKMVDFCNERHLDYRGLIEKGLALEAPEGMYKNE